jgi:hypothetical protein
MLTLIMSVLIGVILLSSHLGASTTRYISLFPLVILTGMVERFWTLETEDSMAASFRTLFQTMFISTVIALILSAPVVARHLFCFPETLGLIMAAQLLIGRYTGYRLSELFRFRDFLREPALYKTRRQGEGETRRQPTLPRLLLVSLSPCLLVSLSPCLLSETSHALALHCRETPSRAGHPGHEPPKRGVHPGSQPAREISSRR